MKFDGDHWRDKRYIAIREELEQAGFKCLRSDEINTSGQIVDEVCRLLNDAALVVIDSSGDSHSVSYEIGYCHGIGRPAEKTLLLRGDANIPFNYRHFRHRVYRDLRHLRRLVRDYLRLSEPLQDDMYGYVFSFEFSDQAKLDYIYDGAVCVFNALKKLNFTGRAECYSAERYEFPGRVFTVGIVLRLPGRKPTPNYAWWQKVVRLASAAAANSKGRIKLDTMMSELAEKRAMKAWLVPCGAAEFVGGQIDKIIGGEGDEDSSFFVYWDRESKAAAAPKRQSSAKRQADQPPTRAKG